jgi:hypothetical protein
MERQSERNGIETNTKNGWILLVCDGRGVYCCYKDSYSRGVAAVQVISRINNASSSTTTTKATKMKKKKKKKN